MSALLLKSLGVVCPSCDLYNPPASARCSGCGMALVQATRPAPSPGATAPGRLAAAPAFAAPAAPLAPAPRPQQVASARSVAAPTVPAPAQVAQAVRPHAAVATPPPLPPSLPPGKRPLARPPTAQAPSPASGAIATPRPFQPVASRFGITVTAGQQQGQRFRLGGAGCMFGRARGAILFPDDPHLSAHHGTLLLKGDRLYVRDEGSLSGIFVAVAQEVLSVGSHFAAGNRLFRFQGALPPAGRPARGSPEVYGAPVAEGQTLYALEEVFVGGRPGRALVSPGPVMTIGRQQGDLTFPGDESLASRHCELAPTDRTAVLRDLSGGLGTWVRIPPGVERPLAPGDRLRVGLQTLQINAIA